MRTQLDNTYPDWCRHVPNQNPLIPLLLNRNGVDTASQPLKSLLETSKTRDGESGVQRFEQLPLNAASPPVGTSTRRSEVRHESIKPTLCLP